MFRLFLTEFTKKTFLEPSSKRFVKWHDKSIIRNNHTINIIRFHFSVMIDVIETSVIFFKIVSLRWCTLGRIKSHDSSNSDTWSSSSLKTESIL
jgi:hypothetical protein